MQRPHDEHQIQTRRLRLHVRQSPVWRRHWRPWRIIWVQRSRKIEGEAGCKRTAIEGTVGSHRRFHRSITAPHPEVGSRTRSRNGVSEFSVAETGTFVSLYIQLHPDELARLRAKVAHLGSQSKHKSSIRGSVEAAEAEDQGRQAPTTHKIWTSGLELWDANEVGDVSQSFI